MKQKLSITRILHLLIISSLLFPLVGCGVVDQVSPESVEAETVKSQVKRASPDDVPQQDITDLTDGNLAFALDLYREVQGDHENLFYSPYSISIALAMTYAGARGETEAQMKETLHYVLPPERLHPAFNALDRILNSRGEEEVPEGAGDPFQLSIANALWGQRDYHSEDPYLEMVARNYGAGLRLLNFLEKAEEARQTINQWVYEKTEGKIEDLIPRGGVGAATRLVLTNAIYFKASWVEKFPEGNTQEAPFYTLDGKTVNVPMMGYDSPQQFRYHAGENFQAVELPYVGHSVSMLVLVPDQGAFQEFSEGLDPQKVKAIIEDMESKAVNLTFPKYEFKSELSLADVLAEMGMPKAMSAEADFSGMTGSKGLFISDVFHKAFVSVNEKGTEAAAATAVVMTETAAPTSPVELTVDRPFFFLIRDNQTGAVLFFGRVLNPVK